MPSQADNAWEHKQFLTRTCAKACPFHLVSITEQAFIAAMLVGVLLITLIFLLAASKIIYFIGATVASVISRVMGFILATIALDAVFVGLNQLGLIALSAA